MKPRRTPSRDTPPDATPEDLADRLLARLLAEEVAYPGARGHAALVDTPDGDRLALRTYGNVVWTLQRYARGRCVLTHSGAGRPARPGLVARIRGVLS